MATKFAVLIVPGLVLAGVLTAGTLDRAARAQEKAEKTVADGVFTADQATRGALAYDSSCAGCHRVDLGGADGPALRGERFTKMFAGKDLRTLYTKIATTMPRGAPASLSDDRYLDIMAYLLQENGFPAGKQDLTTAALSGVQVLPGKAKPPPPVGDFSYVDVVGCLVPGPDNTWLLSNASDPVSLPLTGSSVRQTSDAGSRPLGTQVYRLLDAMAYGPESHKGHKIYVRGLLIRLPGEQRMTISSFEMVAPACSN
ncbi:MAG TPA: cytochrome c [Vicinamibacterales bacterium]|nr:cytochrome c [Vicinamibacterales bacterium]